MTLKGKYVVKYSGKFFNVIAVGTAKPKSLQVNRGKNSLTQGSCLRVISNSNETSQDFM